MAAWATIGELREWADFPAGAGDDAVLQQVLDVAQAQMTKSLNADLLAEDTIVPAECPIQVKHALLMRANALYRRRQTPEGISGVGDFAVVRVSRFDPDVETLVAQYRQFGFT